MKARKFFLFLIIIVFVAFDRKDNYNKKELFLWENANVYFLLTDRFSNGDASQDVNYERTLPTAPLRGFMGGDIKGVLQKLKEGYFKDLGVTALWLSPIFEQNKGIVDEGWGDNYGFHGYWIQDWTHLDKNFGTLEDLKKLVKVAHENKIRVVLDVVLNHTGPVTDSDKVWGNEWVRTSPQCVYKDYQSTVKCTLVKNLPDIKTESDLPVELPFFLTEKWKKEGVYEQEMKELDIFFQKTKYPKLPRYYIIKWLTDYIRELGIDGFRIDTAKHVEESVWIELYKECVKAFSEWKRNNPSLVLDENDFYMVGEVYGYGISGKRYYDFGNKQVDFFNHGFKSLINFEFKNDANSDYETLFTKYSQILSSDLQGKTVLNYISSHDDGQPFDKERKRCMEAGTKLLLTPGSVQIYYGDETGRNLNATEAKGDAVLRSFMNWDELSQNADKHGNTTQEILQHWQKLGTFRKKHPSVGAGIHKQISKSPYIFQRNYSSTDFEDRVLIGLDLPRREISLDISSIFPDVTQVRDHYSEKIFLVKDGKINVYTTKDIILLEKIE
ncbi:MAG: alpha-amylase family glycosyl hydrolase [Chitinophagaceae bacterium]|nr:alpha-amylase family glycosyl hydrolase [Chitinophagaceae bacterium]